MQFRLFITVLFTALPGLVAAQDITGLWKGTLYNDTTQQYHKYEIGISKENGKYSGFSHTWFIINDQQYFGVKKVKVRIAGDGKILVEDDGLITNNYPIPPHKNVRQLNVLSLDAAAETMRLTGPFSTNRTKEYHPLTGYIDLQRKNEFWQSALIPHLQELGRANELSFVREESESLARIAADQRKVAEQAAADKALLAKQAAINQKKTAAALEQEKMLEQKQAEQAAKDLLAQNVARENELKRIEKMEADIKDRQEREKLKTALAIKEAAQREEIAKEKAAQALAKKEAAAKNQAEKEQARKEFAMQQQQRAKQVAEENAARLFAKQEADAKAREEKQQLQLARQAQAGKDKAAKEAAAAQQKANAAAQANASKKTDNAVAKTYNALPAAEVASRTTVLQQTVTFTSDSLLLSLYDNGEIDGDTVSVLMNGELILAKQGLSTT
ncbi:MAG: hypothetical protein EOO03_11205, partial [Chitinophagaceae bacterium]